MLSMTRAEESRRSVEHASSLLFQRLIKQFAHACTLCLENWTSWTAAAAATKTATDEDGDCRAKRATENRKFRSVHTAATMAQLADSTCRAGSQVGQKD
jgi:hypothetical protein